jgi:hypothetical protein
MMGPTDIERAGQDIVSVADNICSDCGWPMDNAFCLETTAVNVREYLIYRNATRWFHDRPNACCCMGSVESIKVGIFHCHFCTYRVPQGVLVSRLGKKGAVAWFSVILRLCHDRLYDDIPMSV